LKIKLLVLIVAALSVAAIGMLPPENSSPIKNTKTLYKMSKYFMNF